jgi:uncharacterized protein YjbJ (UPF0337 family)
MGRRRIEKPGPYGPFVAPQLVNLKEDTMTDKDIGTKGDENRVEGAIDDVKGRVKDAAGGLTGDSSLQAEGKVDRAKGKIKDTIGKVQQDVGRDEEV